MSEQMEINEAAQRIFEAIEEHNLQWKVAVIAGLVMILREELDELPEVKERIMERLESL